MQRLDLRSDTVTRPTPGMRAAMAAAVVGNDVYGEDPTVRELEQRVADLLGKESALFVPSGTMGNQLGLLVHTRPGDEVIIGEGSHCAWYESGAAAALAGVQFAVVGRGGLIITQNPTGLPGRSGRATVPVAWSVPPQAPPTLAPPGPAVPGW